MCAEGGAVGNQNPTLYNLIGRSITGPTACVIAQQYPSSILSHCALILSPPPHSPREILAHVLRMLLFDFFAFFKIAQV